MRNGFWIKQQEAKERHSRKHAMYEERIWEQMERGWNEEWKQKQPVEVNGTHPSYREVEDERPNQDDILHRSELSSSSCTSELAPRVPLGLVLS